MKVVVTGSEGFIGKALVTSLLMQGCEVVKVDRTIGIEAGEYFMAADLTGVDAVFHLAAQTSVFNRNKSDILHDNIETFRVVCDACARSGTRLIYASSSTAASGNATSLYGISKRFDEQYALCYNINATGVRFHNVYGSNPRQGTLLWHLLHDERVKLYNNGMNERHFTYLDDIVGGLMFVLQNQNLPPIVNIANPEEWTTANFAEIVRKYKPIEYECVSDLRDFDREQQCVESEVLTLPLHYTPLEEGIRRIFEGD